MGCASVAGCISWVVHLNSSRPPRHSHLQPPSLPAWHTTPFFGFCIIAWPLLQIQLNVQVEPVSFISDKLRPKGHFELTGPFWDLFGEQIEKSEKILPNICPVSSVKFSILVNIYQKETFLTIAPRIITNPDWNTSKVSEVQRFLSSPTRLLFKSWSAMLHCAHNCSLHWAALTWVAQTEFISGALPLNCHLLFTKL